jgi:hypothetical protein
MDAQYKLQYPGTEAGTAHVQMSLSGFFVSKHYQRDCK